MVAKKGRQRQDDARKVFAWTTRKSWMASPSLVIMRAVLSVLQGLFICACCYCLWWGTDALVGSWDTSADAIATRTQVLTVVGGLLGLYLLLDGIAKHLSSVSREKVSLLLQHEAIVQATQLDLADIESAGKTDLLNKRRGLEHLACGVMDSLYSAVIIAVEFAGLIIMCRIIGWPAFAAVGVLVVITGIRLHPMLRAREKERKNWRESYGRLYYIEHLLSNERPAKEVRLFGLAPLFMPEYMQLARRFARERASTPWGTFKVIFFNALLLGAIVLFGNWMIGRSATGEVSPGLAVMSITVLLLAKSVWMGLGGLFARLQHSAEGVSAYEQSMAMRPSIKRIPESLPVPAREQFHIKFEDVSLTYFGEERSALEDIALAINPGDRIALVGENGSGKTTFVKLLTRLYDPTGGRVTLNGQDLRTFDVEEYRRRFGVIFQDFMRYHGSVVENIGYAQHGRMAEQEAIEEAVRKAGAESVVKGLPEGYDTKLGSWFEKGTGLSDGQWQKLALARAFFRECDILVLDEPTSVIDARAEYQIFKRFMEITEGKTTVMISHRFSTVRMVDQIYVFKEGRIVEHGNHTSLMTADGLYAELFNMQAEGYLHAGERDTPGTDKSAA